MNKNCEIVQDLLPLYIDDVCSETSREMIREHLSGCPDCTKLLKQMQDSGLEKQLEQERTDVIGHQRSYFKRRSALVGMILSVIFSVPVLICLIVNLAVGRSLSWFFIVLAALLFTASLTVTPLLVPDQKGLWTLGLGTGSLILLLAVCCIYTRGNWFFVASSAVLFGLSVLFLPFALRSKALQAYVGERKGLIYMAAVTVLYLLMMICIGIYVKDPAYGPTALAVSAPLLIFFWLLFAIIRYLPYNRRFRAGVCLILSGGFLFAADKLMLALTGYRQAWPVFSPGSWNYKTIDGNVKWTILLSGCVLGIIFICTSFTGRKKK